MSQKKSWYPELSILSIIESLKARRNNGSKVRVMITDVSKSFDSLNHELLLLAKLKAYGFEFNWVTFMRSYLTNKLQHCKIINSFRQWWKVLTGIQQGSILAILPFDIFTNDIFLNLQVCNLTNYVDDSTM